MTTATAVPTRTLHARAVGVARRRFLRVLLLAGLWFWTVWFLLVLGLPIVVSRWGGVATGLSYDTAGSPARWPAFAVGIIATGALLRIHLAAGGTRRALVEGVAGGALVGGVAYGVLGVVLPLLEQQVYAEVGLPWRGPGGAFALDSAARIVASVVAGTLLIVTYALVGTGVLAGYRRWGALRGTLAIVPLLVPCALVDAATRTGVFGIWLRDAPVTSVLDAAGSLAGALLAAALAAVVAHRLLRDVRTRPA
ncbi:hypothetical protein [Isoptericola aurantiacus]|uniref:hypothetical protein n=1 Tax=Isoptericola aurantiacus TaxID=3377839 RepID=UPI00383A3B28